MRIALPELGTLSLRDFGDSQSDIDIDFLGAPRFLQAIGVLRHCAENEHGTGPEPDLFKRLTIGKRIEALLALSTRGGSEPLAIQVNCMRENCEELMEIELSQEEIVDPPMNGQEPLTFPIQINGIDYMFRKPTGGDQIEWLNACYTDRRTAIRAMIRTLCVGSRESECTQELECSAEEIDAIEREIKELDPLVNFELTILCPACNQESLLTIDLEELLLERLHKIQLSLLRCIHRLASHYHWSEREILSIPAHRRVYYLSLLERGDSK